MTSSTPSVDPACRVDPRALVEPVLAAVLLLVATLTSTGGNPLALVLAVGGLAIARAFPGVALGALLVASAAGAIVPPVGRAATAIVIVVVLIGIAGSALALGSRTPTGRPRRRHVLIAASAAGAGFLVGSAVGGSSVPRLIGAIVGLLVGAAIVVAALRFGARIERTLRGGLRARELPFALPTGAERPFPYRTARFDVVAALALLFLGMTFHVGGVGVFPLAAVLIALGVVLRRVAPGWALGAAWGGALLQVGSGDSASFVDVAILVTLYSTAAYGVRSVRLAGAISAGIGSAIAAVVLVVNNGLGIDSALSALRTVATSAPTIILLFGLMLLVQGAAWVIGYAVRALRRSRVSRLDQLAAEAGLAEADAERRAAEERTVVESERGRIARDMHDVVAHSLAVVIAQADGARYASRVDPSVADEAFTTIASTARSALVEVRGLLTELRHEQERGPQPQLADLDALVEQIRATGLIIDRASTGDAVPLGASHEIAVYRIVQEALVNALRHGDPSSTVLLATEWSAEGVVVTVESGIAGDPVLPGSSGGHGLPGMRERAGFAGGTLEVGPAVRSDGAPSDRWGVRARIPITRDPARPVSAARTEGVPS